jgi:aspartate kinase
MALVVHKYGGSSVADAAKILNVARRIALVKESGVDIVAVVSAIV